MFTSSRLDSMGRTGFLRPSGRVGSGDPIGRTATPGGPGSGNLSAGMSPHVHFEIRLGSRLAAVWGGIQSTPAAAYLSHDGEMSMNRGILLSALIVMTPGHCQTPGDQSSFVRVDREMGLLQLGSVPSIPLGQLVVDGDECDSFPYHACGYEDQGCLYYYFDGRLISKEFVFSESASNGPFDIRLGDGIEDIADKLVPYVGGMQAVEVGNVFFYVLECPPMMCRLDLRMEKGVIAAIRLNYSDAV